MYQVKWNKEVVHAQLSAEIGTPEFRNAYKQLLVKSPGLRQYGAPVACLSMLHSKAQNYAQKDRVLHEVISAVQNEPELRTCGFTLLSLAMWPALEHSYYKLLHLADCLPDLWAEIHGGFLDAVMRFNLTKTSRLAINLQMNAEKTVRKAVEKESQAQGIDQAYGFLTADIDCVLDEPYRNRTSQLREWVDQIPEDALKRCLRGANNSRPQALNEVDQTVLADSLRALEERGLITADEGRLIAEHVLQGLELKEIARRMGLQSNAVRGRYFRIKGKLRAYCGGDK